MRDDHNLQERQVEKRRMTDVLTDEAAQAMGAEVGDDALEERLKALIDQYAQERAAFAEQISRLQEEKARLTRQLRRSLEEDITGRRRYKRLIVYPQV